MFWWLVQNTLLAGVLALAAALASRFGRLSPAVRHALWLVVLVKLVTPPVAFYSLPEGEAWAEWLAAGPPSDAPRQTAAIDDSPQPAPETTAAERLALGPAETANEETEESIVEIWEFPGSEVQDSSEIEPEENAGAPAPTLLINRDAEDVELSPPRAAHRSAVGVTATRAGSYALVRLPLVGLWALGAAWMAGLQTVRLLRFRRLLQGARAAPESLTALVAEIAAQLGARAPQIVLTSAACSPMIFAWGRVRLVWPESLAEPFDAEARRAVIAHELAHLRRRDHWVGWLELAASCGWWWNPLFWYVRRQLREMAELACDAWVVELLPGGRRAYAQALVEVSEMISWTAAPAPAVGMGASARHLFERRLTMILRERVPCRAPLVGLALIGLVGIAVLPGWTRGQAEALDKAQPGAEESPELPPKQQPFEENKLEARSDSTLRPSSKNEPLLDEPASLDEDPRHDPFSDSQAAEKRERQAVSVGQAGSIEPSADAADTDLPLGARSIKADRVQQLRQIESIERRMAELADELKALRGQEQAEKKWGDVYAKLPKVAMRREVKSKPQSALVIDLPQARNQEQVQVRLIENEQIRVRSAENQKIGEMKIEHAENMRLVTKSPEEIVLMAVRPGKAVATLMGDEGIRLIIHADILAADLPALADKYTPILGKLDYVASLKHDERLAGAVETLTRAKYKLPPGRAAALAAFIQAQVKDEVETKVDDDTLVVTASSDDQAKIGQFIQLLKTTPERNEASEDRRDDGRSSSDPFSPPVAVDAGLLLPDALPAGLNNQAPTATPDPKPARALPGSQESAPTLSPPEPDDVPRYPKSS